MPTGRCYGSPEYSTDMVPILDPVKNTVTTFHAPVRDPNMPLNPWAGTCGGPEADEAVAPIGARRQIWDTRVNNHNSMFDKKGRVWLAASVRGTDNPAFCKQGSDHPSAKVVADRSHRCASSRCSIRRR